MNENEVYSVLTSSNQFVIKDIILTV